VFTFANTAEALLRDVALTRRVAVAFSQPSTNRTLQLKGCDAAVQPAQPADVAQARRYLALFAAEIVPLGWPPDFAQAVLWHEPAGLMAVRFTPEGAFHQTPGPGAGAPLPLQGGRA
ncbi:MAG: hypothetical protein JNL85_14960, partial [Rubrivivax sp.]|nr:hypothetical protein [Rubrivivax sp.]